MKAPERAYTSVVEQHFFAPRNTGALPAGPDVISAEVGDDAQGVRFRLHARIGGQRIRELRFQAYGCPHCIAAASVLTHRLEGASVDDLERWRWREAAQAVQAPAEKSGRLLVLEDAVHALGRTWRAAYAQSQSV
jgi:NifU-like protein involved in Fe-S cluster formation